MVVGCGGCQRLAVVGHVSAVMGVGGSSGGGLQ